MANKVFKGEIIESRDGTFTAKPRHVADVPETIEGWNITLLTSENSQKRFFCKKQGGLVYDQAKAFVNGDQAMIACVAKPGFGTEPKWEPIEIKKLMSDGSDAPAF